MLKTIIDMLSGNEPAESATNDSEVRLAAVALMVEAALMDGDLDDVERHKIETILTSSFELPQTEASKLVDEAIVASSNSSGWHEMTNIIKGAYDHDQRVALIEHLWEVADADGELHDYEHNLIRRVAGLLYVDDRARAEARRKDRPEEG
jgi:uncharacterized tellurite resistance protein B-like protein